MKRISCGGIVLLALIVSPAIIGCKDKPEEDGPKPGNPLGIDPGGGTAQGDVQRGGQRQVNQNLMSNLGKYYALFKTENGRPPKTADEFMEYVKSDANARNEAAALEKGWLVLILTPNPSANSVLAYEKEAFQKHQNRLVLFVDGSVQMMTEPEFQAALKVK